MIEVATIRPITSLEDIRQVEALQRQVWGFATDTELVPLHMLKATAESGGLLWGAFSPRGDLLGFVMGLLAWQDGRLSHYSHMLGVLPAAQGAGVGFRLKCAQRQAVLLRWQPVECCLCIRPTPGTVACPRKHQPGVHL